MIIKLALNDIKSHSPCKNGWEKLLKSLGKTKADDTLVTFSYIAENNSVSDALWCLRCIDTVKHKKEIALLMYDISNSVLHLTNDKRVKSIKDFANDKITAEQLRSAADVVLAADAALAAADAADAAVWAAADAAVWAAADAAVWAADAADAAVWAAADAAVWAAADAANTAADAERKKQIEFIKRRLG